MMKIIFMIVITLILLSLLIGRSNKESVISSENKSSTYSTLKITIIYDNNEFDNRLRTAWGFSCLVESENETILFDTGGDPETLLENMEKLEIEPKKINKIFLSHIHGDHTGGLEGFLKVNHNVTVYLLKSFPEDFKEMIRDYGGEVIEITGFKKISDGIYTTGELGMWIKEQSMFIETKKGIVVITGCAHPGIVNIVKKVEEISKKNVYLVLGGFHLISSSRAEIEDIAQTLKEMGVKKVAPCHCSGDEARRIFKQLYGDDFILAGVGKIIVI